MSQQIGFSRLALILTENNFATATECLKKLLNDCGFKVEARELDPTVQGAESYVDNSIAKSAIQQMIIVVIAASSYQGCMEDFLKLMAGREFSACLSRFLLFCRIGENPSDLRLRGDFSNASRFKYKSAIIGYYEAQETGQISVFINWITEEMRKNWHEKCLSSMLNGWSPSQADSNIQQLSESLYVYPTGKHKRPFLREISHPLEPLGLHGVENLATWMEVSADQQIADLIYPNKRAPIRPRALIILHFDKNVEPSESMKADWSRLMNFFTFRLDYRVTDIQVDSQGPTGLEEIVKAFAKDEDHGDSCALIVLSQTDGMFSGHSVVNLFTDLALSKPLQGKPRLFILNEWQSDWQISGLADPVSSETFEVLPDAIDSMQGYFGCKKDKSVAVHPHSGMVFGCASTKDSDSKEGSNFIRALCKTYEDYGCTEDVSFMCSLINEQVSKSSDTAPRWVIQTAKLFFITDTHELRATPHAVHDAPLTSNGDHASEKSNADRSGFALILTEYSSDAARNYQTFLEFARFKVHADITDSVRDSLQAALESNQADVERPLVVLVVQNQTNDANLHNIIEVLSQTRSAANGAASTQNSSVLLIYCEVVEVATGQETPRFLHGLPEELPEKFSLACFIGTQSKTEYFLDLLLKDARQSPNLNGIFVVGTDFEHSRFPAGPNYEYKFDCNDPNPGWRKKISWLGNYCVRAGDGRGGSTPVNDDTADDRSSVIMDELNVSEVRKKWKLGKLPAWEPVPDSARALIIHNVVFKSLSTRLGSHHDCQRLTDSLQRLGYKVSIRSNLTNTEIKDEVTKFSNAADHGRTSVVAFMSHGRLGEVFGFDGVAADERSVLKSFSEGEGTRGKPQLAIFQSCRVSGAIPADVSCLAVYPGMIVAHSTLPNSLSLRVKSRGSRFIQSFCAIMDLLARKHDIVTLIPIVNYFMLRSIYEGFSQQPWWYVQSKERFWLAVTDSSQGADGRAAQRSQPDSPIASDLILLFCLL